MSIDYYNSGMTRYKLIDRILELEKLVEELQADEEASKPELGPAYAPAFARLKEACADL